MSETTRRGVIAGAIALLGIGSYYYGFDQGKSPADLRGPDGPEARAAAAIESIDAVDIGELLVAPRLSDLPDDPERSSIGLTGEGIYVFSQSEASWAPIQYGSTQTPVPAVRAHSATVGGSPVGRPLISNGDQTVYVDPHNGDDTARGTEDDPLATIQAAVRRAPIYLRHKFVVDLATVPETPVTYDEDVLVPSIIGTGQAGEEVDAAEPGPFINFVLRGDREAPDAVSIGSVMFGNLAGTSAGNLYGATILRDSPYDDEQYGVAAYGDGEVKLLDVAFSSEPTNGVLVYGARMKARGLDFGQENLDIGLKAKRHASAVVRDPTGALASDGFRATANSQISVVGDRDVSGNPLYNTYRGGLIYDEPSDSWLGLAGNVSVTDTPDRTPNTRGIDVRSEPPGDARPGDVWYIDGSGETAEGFYGQTSEGPTRLG